MWRAAFLIDQETSCPGRFRVLSFVNSPYRTAWHRRVGTESRFQSPVKPGARPFAKAGTPRQTERIRFYRCQAHQGRADARDTEKTGRGTVTHTLSPLHPYLNQVELDCGSELKVTKVTVGDKAAPCMFRTRDGKLSVTLDKAYEPGRYLEPGDRVFRLAAAWAEFVLQRPRLSRKTAGDLDPGRVRGHPPLAPLLRLPQRPRHQRDDHHGRQTPVRRFQRDPGRNQAQSPATRRPITGRWTCRTSAT